MSIVLNAAHPTTARYLRLLTRVEPQDVSTLDVIQTLVDARELQGMNNWALIKGHVDSVVGIYRDASGNILVRIPDDEYVIEWPCRRRVDLSSAERIEGEDGELFVVSANSLVPLPLACASDSGFGWGYSGHGPSALYRSLIGVALGDVPAGYDTHYLLAREREDGLYFWLEHSFENGRPFTVEWPEMVTRVRVEVAWRRRIDEAYAYTEAARH